MLDLVERNLDIPHIAVKMEVLVFHLDARHVFPDQADDLVLCEISAVGPHVEHLAAHAFQRGFESQPEGPADVADMDERAVELFLVDDQLSFLDRLEHELVDDQVETRPRRRPEKRGKAKNDGCAAGALGLFEQVILGGDLGFGVKRLRVEGRIFSHGIAVVGNSVIAVGRGEDEAPGAMPLGELKDVCRSVEVAAVGGLVSHLLAGGIPDDGGQVDDMIDAGKIGLEARPVADIRLVKSEMGVGHVAEERIPAERQIIDDDDPVAAKEQLAAEERADISGPSCHQDLLWIFRMFHGAARPSFSNIPVHR